MKTSLKADLLLLLVTFFWGSTYALTKIALEVFSPVNLISLRFIVAFLVAAAIFHKRLLRTDRTTIYYSFLLSIVLFFTFMAMNYGVKYTTASNAAFLAGLTVIFIALGGFFFLGGKLEKKTWFCVLLATLGVSFLTMSPDLKLSMGLGDILSLFVAILYAVFVLLTDKFTRKVDSLCLGILQIGFVGLISTLWSLVTETYTLPTNGKSLTIVFFLGVLCTGLAFVAQTVAQKYTSPTHTGIILSMETVFSGIFAYILVGEVLRPINYVGAFLLVVAIFLMEIDLKSIRNKLLKERK